MGNPLCPPSGGGSPAGPSAGRHASPDPSERGSSLPPPAGPGPPAEGPGAARRGATAAAVGPGAARRGSRGVGRRGARGGPGGGGGQLGRAGEGRGRGGGGGRGQMLPSTIFQIFREMHMRGNRRTQFLFLVYKDSYVLPRCENYFTVNAQMFVVGVTIYKANHKVQKRDMLLKNNSPDSKVDSPDFQKSQY